MNFFDLALGFVKVLAPLILIHELGHFAAARWFGVRVEVFSVGFGPRLLGVRWGDTDYRLALLPLGGYVRMAGEMPGDPATGDPALLPAKPKWQRFVIMLAGPAINIALAIVVWWAMFVHGAQTLDIPEGPPFVEAVTAGSPAESAGLREGDRIVALGGKALTSLEDYQEQLLFSPGRSLTYTIERDGARKEVPVKIGTHPRYSIGWDGVRVRWPVLIGSVTNGQPAARAGIQAGDRVLEVDGRVPGGTEAVAALIQSSADGAVRFVLQRGTQQIETTVQAVKDQSGQYRVGIGLTLPTKLVKYGAGEALVESLKRAQHETFTLFRTLEKLFSGQLGIGVMSGPLEIARISQEQSTAGWEPFFHLLAFISLQLGVFNLLPIPVLDGGHMLILVTEGILRRDLPAVLKERVLLVGLVLLLSLAAVVIWLDIGKWSSGRTAVVSTPAAPSASQPQAKPPDPTPPPAR